MMICISIHEQSRKLKVHEKDINKLGKVPSLTEKACTISENWYMGWQELLKLLRCITYIYMYVCMYVRTYVRIYIYIYCAYICIHTLCTYNIHVCSVYNVFICFPCLPQPIFFAERLFRKNCAAVGATLRTTEACPPARDPGTISEQLARFFWWVFNGSVPIFIDYYWLLVTSITIDYCFVGSIDVIEYHWWLLL